MRSRRDLRQAFQTLPSIRSSDIDNERNNIIINDNTGIEDGIERQGVMKEVPVYHNQAQSVPVQREFVVLPSSRATAVFDVDYERGKDADRTSVKPYQVNTFSHQVATTNTDRIMPSSDTNVSNRNKSDTLKVAGKKKRTSDARSSKTMNVAWAQNIFVLPESESSPTPQPTPQPTPPPTPLDFPDPRLEEWFRRGSIAGTCD
ncbi:hypothetical protein MHU86_8995 [Fragilaria crotonensis]|nr:hypothetical protein MHU86_8995 [Fragilaria crotonensis]